MSNDYNYVSVADTAKLVRVQLAKRFNGAKFSVRSKSYSGGASIDISWIDGPTVKQVQRITCQFTGADFDGMIDMKTHNSSWLLPDGSACVAHASGTEGSRGVIPSEDHAKPHSDAKLVHFGADYIFCHRIHSVEAMKEAVREVCLEYGYQLCRVEDDGSYGGHLGYNDPLADQGADNPTSIWTLRNLVHSRLEGTNPYGQEITPQPGDAEYEALKARVAEISASVQL